MKKLILLVLLFTNIVCFAQYPQTNIIKALVFYKIDSNGYYYVTKDTIINSTDSIISYYGYDKKNKHLYTKTENSNCEITVTKDLAKSIKKSNIPKLKKDALLNEILKVNENLKNKYDILNAKWKKHIEDSIEIVEVKIKQARLDSIEKAKEDSLTQERANELKNEYRLEHNWHWVPTPNTDLNCSLCDYKIHTDSIYCLAINNNCIYHLEKADSALGHYCLQLHKFYIPNSLQNNIEFQYYYKVFQDSLTQNKSFSDSLNVKNLNLLLLDDYFNALTKKAPYGYIDNWSWSSDYSMITFDFSYVNMNKKTIKYIDIYFCVTNDVNDICRTGHFKGIGPLKEFGSANWSWDRSSYFVSGDASNMKLTKIIITYMDGTQKILSKNMIKDNMDY